MLDITFTNSTKHKAFSGSFFKKIILIATKETGLEKKQVGLSVNLVGKAKIRALNKKYRNKDKATDVLSFPLSTGKDVKNKGNAILELGDIFICPNVAVHKAREHQNTLKDEMKFLIVHGFLHLLGHDHEQSVAEKKKMFSLQDKILNKI